MHKLTSTLFIFIFSVPALAATLSLSDPARTMVNSSSFVDSNAEVGLLLLAETEQQDKTPEPGSLVIPGEPSAEDKDKKQCLKVCKKWGENCIINPRTGARTCRRACKEFGEECF